MTSVDDRPAESPGDSPAGSVLRVLDRSGDSTVRWTPGNADEERAAREHFATLRGKGYLAYRRGEGGQRGETVHDWERDNLATAGEVLMVPATVGG